MSILKYIDRLKQMDDLIKRKATGTPEEFAEKLGICKSMLMLNINELKALGAPVKYSHQIRSYYYCEQGHLEIKFRLINSMHSIKGGFYLSEISSDDNIFTPRLSSIEINSGTVR